MIAAATAIVLAAVVVILVGALARTAPTDRLLRERLRQDVIVTLRSGEAFRGVLYAADVRSLVLREVKMLTDASAHPMVVDGELIVARDHVDYLQRP